MKIAVRNAYPEKGQYDWSNDLPRWEKLGTIEVAFYKVKPFLTNVLIKDVVEPFSKLALYVPDVHMAHARLTIKDEFLTTLIKTIKVAKALNSSYIVVHPSFGQLKDIKIFLQTVVTPLLEQNDLYISWETFESKRRIFGGPEGIIEFCKTNPRYKMCYDFSHIHKPEKEVLKDIEKYFSCLAVLHASNRISSKGKQHLPLFQKRTEFGRTDLDFKKIIAFLKAKNYQGSFVLEYLYEYHSLLLKDALRVKELLSH